MMFRLEGCGRLGRVVLTWRAGEDWVWGPFPSFIDCLSKWDRAAACETESELLMGALNTVVDGWTLECDLWISLVSGIRAEAENEERLWFEATSACVSTTSGLTFRWDVRILEGFRSLVLNECSCVCGSDPIFCVLLVPLDNNLLLLSRFCLLDRLPVSSWLLLVVSWPSELLFNFLVWLHRFARISKQWYRCASKAWILQSRILDWDHFRISPGLRWKAPGERMLLYISSVLVRFCKHCCLVSWRSPKWKSNKKKDTVKPDKSLHVGTLYLSPNSTSIVQYSIVLCTCMNELSNLSHIIICNAPWATVISNVYGYM